GRIHTREDIQGYVIAGKVQGTLGNQSEHGTRVASIAAGSPMPGFPGGVAPRASLLVVIPKLEVVGQDPHSIGYSIGHTGALAYVREFAAARKLPVVVNVSLGMNAGAHDGTSALETAFDSFSSGGTLPGLAIVKSAGNLGEVGAHAQLQLAQGLL